MAAETGEDGREAVLSRDGFSDWGFDSVIAGLSVLLVGGIVYDIRRHVGGISFAEEGFFTVEHAFFYSVFVVIAVLIGARTIAARRAGRSWLTAAPVGYGWGLVGVGIFGLGGVFDMLWHTAFGFEEGVRALTSPSHLSLGIGGALFLSGPLRAAWHRTGNYDGLRIFPVAASATLVLSFVSVFGGLLNPLWHLWHRTTGDPFLTLGIVSFTVFPLAFVGMASALVRQFDLPLGVLTIVFLGPGIVSTSFHGEYVYVLPVLVAGIVADVIAKVQTPVPEHSSAFRLFCTLVPIAMVGTYVAIAAGEDVFWWSIHAWAGALLIPGLSGVLFSFAISPTGQ